jgi:hypothetical protein
LGTLCHDSLAGDAEEEAGARVSFLSRMASKAEAASITTSEVARISPGLAAACAAEGCDLAGHIRAHDTVTLQAQGLKQMAESVKSITKYHKMHEAPVALLADLHGMVDGWVQHKAMEPLITVQLKKEINDFRSAHSLKSKAAPLFADGMYDLKARMLEAVSA